MKILCIDYGSKKCGLATSDDTGVLAFPYKILPTQNLLSEVKNILKNTKFTTIIIGESVNSQGLHNNIFIATEKFIKILKDELKILQEKNIVNNMEVILEKEFFTSKHAREIDGKRDVDDRAAALILQRYLDRKNMSKSKII